MKNYKVLLLVAAMLLGIVLTACAPEGNIENGFLDEISFEESAETSESETSAEESKAPAGYANKPVITSVINVTPQDLVIVGKCDEGCTVTVTDGIVDASAESIEGHFVIEYTIDSTTFVVLSATAESDKLKTSEITSFRVEYDSTAMKRIDGYGVTVGANSHFYYDFDLACYTSVINNLDGTTSSTLLTQTQIKKFKESVNLKVKNFKNRAGSSPVELVYVLVPNTLSINPENLKEGTVRNTYKTRYEQVVEAIGQTDARVVDMTDVFLAEKKAGNKIFYDTDSHLTEYGGYLVYKAICDVLAERFPDAKARDISKDFTKTSVVCNGGNTAKSLGLDVSVVTEKADFYTPKFSLKLGKEDKGISSASGYIADFDKYDTDKSMLLASGTGTLAQRMLFATGNTKLPCALIYRDDVAVTFSDILAERFNRVLLALSGDFTVNMTDAQRYYGVNPENGKNRSTVDYIIVIVSEANLNKIVG